jgi:ABC-2 type transport system ATP-binding protein
MQSIIAINNLTKEYASGFKALDDVSLAVESGRIFGLLGANGAGKSTLINIIAGLVKKTSGSIEIAGLNIDKHPIKYKHLIGIVPQEIHLDPFFSVREYLEIYGGYYGVPNLKNRIDEVLEVLSLTDKQHATSRRLSGGMKRRLLIAKAIIHNPKVLFLDEPTAGVDVELRQQLWDYVLQLKEQGTTIILTTHYLEEAERLCDDICFIAKGKVLRTSRKADIMQQLGSKHLDLTLADGRVISINLANDNLDSFLKNNSVVDITSRQTSLEEIFVKITG